MSAIRIAIIDDHQVVLDGLNGMLANYRQFTIVCATRNREELLQQVSSGQIDIVLMDIQMPEFSGIELCKQITRLYPATKIIAFSSFDDSNYVKQMFRSGAKGYLLKNSEKESIVQAIESVAAGQEYMDEMIKEILLQETLSGQRRSIFDIPLTKRENEILKLIAEGLSSQEMADKLFVSLRTIESHRLNINQKLGAKNTAGLLKEAHKRGLVN